jgi:hypothetical protein
MCDCELTENCVPENLTVISHSQVIEEMDGVEVVTNQELINTWMERDVDACSIIFYNIEPAYQTSIEGSATAHEMWNRLILQYAQVAVANSAHLLGKFHQYRMDPGKSLHMMDNDNKKN